ncbi:DNA polymerase III subunit delta [Lapidilactobacillus mulanensis]|uniref:DNA polymerase III subunit delta n=1 Tax=Lapidilactobacillus mulanensis TaxID=2485999 RepID=A0ABW4DME9_9LACO|nr:DNA polymerase III subunit delta [Lapidilactobacillus mulanensis]
MKKLVASQKSNSVSVSQLEKMTIEQLPAVILVLGKEQALLDQIKNYFEKLLSPEERDMNYGRYDLSEDTIGAALDDAASVPFFGDWRLLLVTQPTFLTGEARKGKVEHEFDALLDYLKQPQPSTKLIFWANYEKLDERKKVTKALKKEALIIDASELKGYHLTSMLNQAAAELQVTIEPRALELLLHRVDEHYTLAVAKLKQLALFVGPGQPIKVADVDQAVEQVIEDDVFQLVAETLGNKQQQALQLYQHLLLNGNEPIQLLALITTQVRLLLQAKILRQAGYAQGDIASQMKIHPYRVKLALQQEQKFGLTQLKNMFQELVDLDYKIKTGQAEKAQSLELLIIKFSATPEKVGI